MLFVWMAISPSYHKLTFIQCHNSYDLMVLFAPYEATNPHDHTCKYSVVFCVILLFCSIHMNCQTYMIISSGLPCLDILFVAIVLST